MRIQRNRRSPSAVAAPSALSASQQRCAAPHRGLPLPSRKGAGVWLPK
jgi:hypothetical protein